MPAASIRIPPGPSGRRGLLWQLVPFQYPPLESLEHGRQADTTATTFYDPASGVVSLSERIARWPRAVSLLHEALHAQQSQPGPVSWAMLGTRPWIAADMALFGHARQPPGDGRGRGAGPIAGQRIGHCRAVSSLPAGQSGDRSRLDVPSGRSLSVEWMLRQAHRHGVFGDTAGWPGALGARHGQVVGINELLGETTAGRQFVSSLVD